jgi:hypothetical protein
MASIVDRIRAIFGGSKDDDGDREHDRKVAEEEAIEAVQRDRQRNDLDAVDRLTNTPGSGDGGSPFR